MNLIYFSVLPKTIKPHPQNLMMLLSISIRHLFTLKHQILKQTSATQRTPFWITNRINQEITIFHEGNLAKRQQTVPFKLVGLISLTGFTMIRKKTLYFASYA